MNKEWDRTDYLEDSVKRNAEDLRQLTKLTHENAAALSQLIGEVSRLSISVSQELERRQSTIDSHETRIRELEGWKSRSGAYWAIVGTFAGAAAALLVRQLGQGVLP